MCICVDVDNGEPTTILKKKIAKSLKKYKCDECKGNILPGELYQYVSGVCEGDFFVHRTCGPCVEVRDRLMSCGYFFGEMWSDINEAIDSIGIGDLDGLSLDAIGKFEEMTRDASLSVCRDCNETIDGIETYINGIDGPLCESCAMAFEEEGGGE